MAFLTGRRALGTVLGLPSWLPVEGATVTLQPGGFQAITDVNGAYAFSSISPGEYTVTATLGVGCRSLGDQPYLIDGQALTLELYLTSENGDPCPPEQSAD